ncbi:MAG: 3-oxoacyl-ACP synthase [Rubrivivax sp.]|jgi:3-oxoacyl-[acyl-carrier-protein] synthase-3|nr:3-oxoacyl-ACP synthase [Rubrivivax sp.]
MIGIAASDYVLGREQRPLAEWADEQQLSTSRLQALVDNGVANLHRARGETLLGLGVAAVQRLLDREDVDPASIDALVVCQTSPCNTLPMPFTLAGSLRSALRLQRAWTFSVAQQQCVSELHALRVLQALFARRTRWQRALVVGVDTILREDLRAIGDAGVHSDGASALLVTRDAPCRLLAVETYNDARSVEGIRADGSYEANDNYLWSLVSVVRRLARSARVQPLEFQQVLPHNVNLPSWLQAMDTLRIPRERLFTRNFARIGHVFGSDAAINLADSGALVRRGPQLVFASGIGGAFGALALALQE